MFSPPSAAVDAMAPRDGSTTIAANSAEYEPPTGQQISDATIDELRAMFQSCLAENARLKMETAHYKLQYNLLSMQADEDAKRAAVEHDMARREVEVLRSAEEGRQARKDLSAAAESAQAKYLQLKILYDAVLEDNESLHRRSKLAKKVIQQKEDDIVSLTDERDLLLNRIRENREHFHMLCSPGGAFHGALTPKTPAVASPAQYRAAARQTPKSMHRDPRHGDAGGQAGQAGFAALLQALSHPDNNSAPSTPHNTSSRPAPRTAAKHSRGVQSLSSLPCTPTSRPTGGHAGLLPSVDLVPQTEPAPRLGGRRRVPDSPTPRRVRKSRESTISEGENEHGKNNEQLARAALESVAAATQSYMSHEPRASHRSARRHDPQDHHDDEYAGGEEDGNDEEEEEGEEEEDEVLESQASQAATEMLRHDPRERFDVVSSGGSRDGSPMPAEKSAKLQAKLQAKLFASVNKPGMGSEKRKYGGGVGSDGARHETLTSPTKKMRHGAVGRDTQGIGLGIQYGQEV